MAYFESYSPIIGDVSGLEQLVELEESPQVQSPPQQQGQKHKVFQRKSNRRKTLVFCAVTAGIFALGSFIAEIEGKKHLYSSDPKSGTNDEVNGIDSFAPKFITADNVTSVNTTNSSDSATRTPKNEYFGLDGRLCRLINVDDPELVVNLANSAIDDGSMVLLWDKSESNWNSNWRAKTTRGGVRFEVISPTGVLKVLAENATTHLVIISGLEEPGQNNLTLDTPSNQVWILEQRPSGAVKIKNQGSGRYLKSYGKSLQLMTTPESMSDGFEYKRCQWDISFGMTWIWNREKDYCKNYSKNI